MTGDSRRILAAQAARAFGYGFGAVLLGVVLRARGWPASRVGVLLALVVAGTVAASLVVGWMGDRLGRRRLYGLLFVGLAGAGIAFGLSDRLWVLGLVALTGTLSTEVVESGPFTSLEQAMLAQREPARRRTRTFGAYNAVATLAGAAGALAAGGPGLLHRLLPGMPGAGVPGAGWAVPGGPAGQRWFLLLVPVGLAGALLAGSLSARVEADAGPASPAPDGPGTAQTATAATTGGRSMPLGRSRPTVLRLAGLFAVDAFGGGFVVQAFIAYWLAARFGASAATLGVVFFAVGLLQTASFLAATRLAERIGLLPTMVFTHLPSNLLLAAIAFAPSLPVAVGLLLARQALSQMDVPTRQAYVMALVDPAERTAAAAWTNTARYLARPAGPALAGVAGQLALGVPFLVAGAVKVAYDLALWGWFRRVEFPDDTHDSDDTADPARGRGHRAPWWRSRSCWGRQEERGVIVCWRTVRIPPAERDRFNMWIEANRTVRERHGIVFELVLGRSPRQNPPRASQPPPARAAAAGAGAPGAVGALQVVDAVAVTAWASHAAFDAWTNTPDRDRLTASPVHQAATSGRSPATTPPAATSTSTRCVPSRPAAPLSTPARSSHEQGAAMNWVTRARPKTDRIACPWLIRRFIDPDAEIRYVPADQVLTVAEIEAARSFDAPDAEFTHRGNQCTFEVLIDEFHLDGDPALARLARIVHAADIAHDLDSDPLGRGLLAIGEGGLAVEADDQRLLEKGMFVYDALYAWCQSHPDPT